MRSPAWIVVALLSVTAGILLWRGDPDRVPSGQPLASLPLSLDSWKGVDLPLASYTLDALGHGTFLNRLYAPLSYEVVADGEVMPKPISLFIGYYASQRAGETIHSPQACLPGGGWTFDQRGVTDFEDNRGQHYRVGQYLISNSEGRQEVLYWYRSHGRTIADDYAAKLYTSLNSIRDRRTDAALIRVMTPLGELETQQSARGRLVRFAQQIAPLLPAYIPD